MSLLIGIHPIREALLADRPIDRILISKGAASARLQEIIDLARTRSVPVRFEPRGTLDRAANNQPHQAVIAYAAATEYAPSEDVIAKAKLLVILDGVEDPHNLGAIARTALAAGADAILIPERRAAGLTDTVAKAAAGALEYLPIVRITNVTRTLEELKEKRYWIYGLDERGENDYDKVEYTAPTAIVLGSEGKGLHQLVKQHCDFLVRIPLAGKISSLNVSVAAGVVLFDWKRRTQQG
jgi:23S rRNA (guanosine2251-2'-O)-methyltransferase